MKFSGKMEGREEVEILGKAMLQMHFSKISLSH